MAQPYQWRNGRTHPLSGKYIIFWYVISQCYRPKRKTQRMCQYYCQLGYVEPLQTPDWNGQKGMLQTDAPLSENFWLRHWVGLLIIKLRKVYLLSLRVKKLKSVNIRQSYKQERDCLVHFVRLANALIKDGESVRNKQFAPRSRQITTSTPHHSNFTGRTLFQH